MKFRDAITAGIAHLAQNKLRAGLSILGIFIGIASVLCMIAIGDGAKLLIAQDIDTLGGANQVQFWTRTSIWKRRRLVRRTTERYTLEDALAIEAECPNVLYVLPKHEGYTDFCYHPKREPSQTPFRGCYCRLRTRHEMGVASLADSFRRGMLKMPSRCVSSVPIPPLNCLERNPQLDRR